MWRIVFHFLAGVSLLIFVALMPLWIGSKSTQDVITGDLSRQGRQFAGQFRVESASGAVTVEVAHTQEATPAITPRSPKHEFFAIPLDLGPAVHEPPFRFDGQSSGIFVMPGYGGAMMRPADINPFSVPSTLAGHVLRGHRLEISVPYWLLTLSTSVMPAILIWRRRRRRVRQRIGLCQSCGYDLRATPGRCPECGRVPRAGAGKNEQRISSV